MKRRDLLAAVAGSSVGLAGCVGGQPIRDDTAQERTSDNSDALQLETVSADCASPHDDWAFAMRDDEQLIIRGTTPSPNPCHEAVLVDSSHNGRTLELVIDVESIQRADEECPQCAGAVGYAMTVDTDNIETVDIEHTVGENHNLTIYDATESPVVTWSDIETTDSSCGTGDRAEVTVIGQTIAIEGVLMAANPCHVAVLDEASISGSTLRVEVGTESTLDKGEVCIECVGEITYNALVELEGPPTIDSIQIDHSNGETHEIELSMFDEM